MYQQYNSYYHSDFYSMPNHDNGVGTYYGGEDELGSSATTSSVDCTLSLGTPSTRSMDGNAKEKKKKKQSSYLSSFWNMVPSRNTTTASTPPQMAAGKGHRGGGNGGDTMFARRCANCDTTSTPLWRNGPRGPKSLCNACGIRYKKEQRAAAGEGVQSQRMSCYSSSEYRFVDDEDRRPDANSGVIPFLSWRFNLTDRPSFIHDFTS